MKVEAKTTVRAGADEIFDHLLRPDFYRELEERLKKVSSVELMTVEELDGEGARRVVRFEAPTQFPRFLRRFEDRAPREVSWEDIGVIDRLARQMTFTIRPDVPDHWHEMYKNSGLMTVTGKADGTSEVVYVVDFSIDSPGLGFLIERALRGEVAEILKAQADLLHAHFG